MAKSADNRTNGRVKKNLRKKLIIYKDFKKKIKKNNAWPLQYSNTLSNFYHDNSEDFSLVKDMTILIYLVLAE